jgi:hypothetical protein
MKGVSKKKKFQNTQFSIQAEHYKGKPIKRWRRKAKGAKALCHASQLQCNNTYPFSKKRVSFLFCLNVATVLKHTIL